MKAMPVANAVTIRWCATALASSAIPVAEQVVVAEGKDERWPF